MLNFYNREEDKPCKLCKTKLNNIKLGPRSKTEDITAHYFCVLLSYRIKQSGQDNEGIEGFLKSDIEKVIRSSRSIKCHYCGKNGASIRCENNYCKLHFHLPCGIKHNIVCKFEGTYPTFCLKHRPRQYVYPEIAEQNKNVDCGICMSNIVLKSEMNDIIWASCCKRNMFLHRICAQKYAWISGASYKCPNCSDKDKFHEISRKYGVFIPQRDAIWEYEHFFDDLYEQNIECSADKCLAATRDVDKENSLWELLICLDCGSLATHRACSDLKLLDSLWTCPACTPDKNLQDEKSYVFNNALPCNSKTCLSSKGRRYEDENEFKKILCKYCSKISIHQKCLQSGCTEWYCILHEQYTRKQLFVKLYDITKNNKYSFDEFGTVVIKRGKKRKLYD